MERYIHESIEFWGGPSRLNSYPLEEPIVASEIRPRHEWSRFAYVRDINEPRDIIDAVVVGLERREDVIGYLSLNRHASNGEIRHSDLEGLRLVVPHIRRAVTIANLFDFKVVEAATFRSVVDEMACAVVLVRPDLTIVHANPSAERLLAEGDVLSAQRGKISVHGNVADQLLRSAIEFPSNRTSQPFKRAVTVPAVGREGTKAALHVLPLEASAYKTVSFSGAAAAIFIVTGAHHAPVDVVAALYNLTPAEARLVEMLCQDKTLAEAARAQSIGIATVKTHLLRVFAKTGCTRQAELVALTAKYTITI
ncbi:MAG: hypothetical protein U1E62_22755 [Alsobacter sp.]